MNEDIAQVGMQFAFEPKIQNASVLGRKKSFIIAGVGGSALAADLLRVWRPDLDIIIHRNYGLPEIPTHRIGEYLFIASSYSGNTDEVQDSLSEALKRGMAVVIIATGGKLLEKAKIEGLPYIELTQYNIPTRLTIGIAAKAILACMGEWEGVNELSQLTDLNPGSFEEPAKLLAQRLIGSVPLIFASQKNLPLSYAWQVQFNEYKTPAFTNRFPELSHNAIHGLEGTGDCQKIAQKFHVIFLTDANDDSRIQKGMATTQSLLEGRGLTAENIALTGEGFRKIFNSFFLANRTAQALEQFYASSKNADLS